MRSSPSSEVFGASAHRRGALLERRLVGRRVAVSSSRVRTLRARDMFAAEAALHDTFRGRRVRGEWFRLTEADIAFIHDGPRSIRGLL